MIRSLLLLLALSSNAVSSDQSTDSIKMVGFEKTIVVTPAALKDLPGATFEGDDHGTRATWTGVKFLPVLERAGAPVGERLRGSALNTLVVFHAADGYRVTFTLAEFDEKFGNNGAILAWQRDGRELSEKEGPFRLVVPGDRRAARGIRQVTRIELVVP